MTLKRQLLLISLLALMLPWAGCEFIRETESALRSGQQQMLAGMARALADAMAGYSEEYPDRLTTGQPGEQIFVHSLSSRPTIDGYFEDWPLDARSLRTIDGADGPIQLSVASYDQRIYVFVDVTDHNVIYLCNSADDGSG
jgi:hypothetical protein